MEQQLQTMFMLTDKPIISMDPKKLQDHPLNETLFGDLKQSDYQELKEDIAKRGIQDPLHITKDNIIVSGHQRKKVALDLGINVPCIIRNDLIEEWQIEEQLISDNLLRRHLSDYLKVECGERLRSIETVKAKQRLKMRTGGVTKENLPESVDKGQARDKVAEKIGMSGRQYDKARKIYKEAPEPIKQDWKQGKISTHAAFKKLQSEQKKQQRKTPTETPDLPNDTYDVIYADPPWRYDFHTSISREIEQKYPTMTMDELKKLELPVNGNAVLYLWGTSPKLKDALELMESWGFEYKTHAIWDKEKIGMGMWFRGQHELLLVGTKGNFSPPETKNRVSSVFRIPRTKHSKKPDEIRNHIASCFPNHKKIELFAREKTPGWDIWGNET